MGKRAHGDVLDAPLNTIKNEATQICVCSAEPTTYLEATATFMLAKKSDLTSGSFTGPVDDTSGRKLTVNLQPAVPLTNAGNATHVALCDADDRVLFVTTCNLVALGAAPNTVTIPAYKIGNPEPV